MHLLFFLFDQPSVEVPKPTLLNPFVLFFLASDADETGEPQQVFPSAINPFLLFYFAE